MRTAVALLITVLVALLTPAVASAAPTQPDLTQVDLGLPGADCYEVLALATDTGRLYALCGRGEGGRHDLTVVALDTGDGRPVGVNTLPSAAWPATTGVLTLDAAAGRLYVLSDALDGVRILDVADLRLRGGVPGVREVIPLDDGGFLALGDAGPAVYPAAGLTPRASLDAGAAAGAVRAAYDPRRGHLYVAGVGLTVLRATDLSLVATLPLTGLQAVTFDVPHDRLVAASDDGRWFAIEGATLAVTERRLAPAADVVQWLLPDPRRGWLHLIGERAGQGYWQVVEAATLEVRATYGDFLPWGAVALTDGGDLLAVRRGGEVVGRYRPDQGPPGLDRMRPVPTPNGCCGWVGGGGRWALGRRVVAAAVWPETGWVYALDASGGLHVLDRVGLEVFEDCPDLLGSAHPGLTVANDVDIILDTQRGRLYVADRLTGQLHIIEAATLEWVGTLPLAGTLALDVAAGRLLVTDGVVWVLDVSDLEALPALPAAPTLTFGLAAARAAVFDGGRLYVLLADHTADARRVLFRAFDPATLRPQADFRLPSGTTQAWLTASEAAVWVAYAGADSDPGGTGRRGLIRFDADQTAGWRVEGVAGPVWVVGDRLLVRQARDVRVVDAGSGEAVATWASGFDLQGGAWDAVGETLTLWGWNRLATLRW